VTAVLARIDHARVREHVVDANDGIIASAGIVEGLLGAGASSTILLVASLAAMIGGGFALAGMRYSEAADERDAQHATLEAERRRIALTRPRKRPSWPISTRPGDSPGASPAPSPPS
jgi:hypothetical protein